MERFKCNKLNSSVFSKDVPEFDPDELHKFSKPVITRVGQNAAFKMPFPTQESLVVNWFSDGTQIKDGGGVKIAKESNHSRLVLRDCLRTDAGEIKIQLKNPFGAVEAMSKLIVLGKEKQRNVIMKVKNTLRYKRITFLVFVYLYIYSPNFTKHRALLQRYNLMICFVNRPSRPTERSSGNC